MHGGFGGHGGAGHHGGGHAPGHHGGDGSSLGHSGHHVAGGIFAHLAHMLSGHHGGHGGHGAGAHAGQANHPQNVPNWSSAIQAEKTPGVLKIAAKPGLYALGIFSLMVFWLFVIRFVHHRDEPEHLVSSEKWAQQITASNPRAMAAAAPQFAQPADNQPSTTTIPAGFGSPGPDYQAPSAPTAGNPVAGNAPMPMAAGGAPTQMFNSLGAMSSMSPSGFTARTFSARMQTGGLNMSLPRGNPNTPRYKVIVSR